MAKSAIMLKDYLSDIDFHSIYKYLVGGNNYISHPEIVNIDSKSFFSLQMRAANVPVILDLLLLLNDVDLKSLSPNEIELACQLAKENFITIDNGVCKTLGYQLISFNDFYLLIDGRINFQALGFHRSYIGVDSYLMLYYISRNKFNQNSVCLDICSGTGIGALFAALFSKNVTAIEIDDFAINLINFNRALNFKENEIKIINHDLFKFNYPQNHYDLITCNPPFVLIPDEFGGPLYAKGFGKDGLDHLRFLVKNAEFWLKNNGVAYYIVDLLGDDSNPFFIKELEKLASSSNIEITVFIDNKLDARINIKALTSICYNLNPEINRDVIRQKVSTLIVKELGASHYYLSTIMIAKNSNKNGLRIFNRQKFLTSDGKFKNVVSLPTT